MSDKNIINDIDIDYGNNEGGRESVSTERQCMRVEFITWQWCPSKFLKGVYTGTHNRNLCQQKLLPTETFTNRNV